MHYPTLGRQAMIWRRIFNADVSGRIKLVRLSRPFAHTGPRLSLDAAKSLRLQIFSSESCVIQPILPPHPLLSPSKAALPGLIRGGFIDYRPTRRHNLPTITTNQDEVRRSRRGLYPLLHWTKSSALPLRAAYMFSSPPAFHQ